jgi:hypothetical protein
MSSILVRDEFDLTASTNLAAPSEPNLVSVLCEKAMRQQVGNP